MHADASILHDGQGWPRPTRRARSLPSVNCMLVPAASGEKGGVIPCGRPIKEFIRSCEYNVVPPQCLTAMKGLCKLQREIASCRRLRQLALPQNV